MSVVGQSQRSLRITLVQQVDGNILIRAKGGGPYVYAVHLSQGAWSRRQMVSGSLRGSGWNHTLNTRPKQKVTTVLSLISVTTSVLAAFLDRESENGSTKKPETFYWHGSL
jgi:hypothetical protein